MLDDGHGCETTVTTPWSSSRISLSRDVKKEKELDLHLTHCRRLLEAIFSDLMLLVAEMECWTSQHRSACWSCIQNLNDYNTHAQHYRFVIFLQMADSACDRNSVKDMEGKFDAACRLQEQLSCSLCATGTACRLQD